MSNADAIKARPTPARVLKRCATCLHFTTSGKYLICRVYGAQLCLHEACTAYDDYKPTQDADGAAQTETEAANDAVCG